MDMRVRKILILMENNLDKKPSFSEIAQSVNLSVWHLRRLFKAETDMTPAKYLKHLRLQKAKYLLETSFLSIKEIRVKIGVHDESHFIRDFRELYGMTPLHYRTYFLKNKAMKVNQPK